MMPREGAIFNDVIGTLGAPRAALLTFATAFLASISAANSEDEALIRQLAEFEKTQGLITGYTANKEDYHLDVTISSTTPLPKGEATLTGRTTCYLGTRGLARKLEHTWTVQVFVPGEAPAAYTCESPPLRLKTRRPIANDHGSMPREGAIIFSDRIDKLVVLQIECPKCDRPGHCQLHPPNRASDIAHAVRSAPICRACCKWAMGASDT